MWKTIFEKLPAQNKVGNVSRAADVGQHYDGWKH